MQEKDDVSVRAEMQNIARSLGRLEGQNTQIITTMNNTLKTASEAKDTAAKALESTKSSHHRITEIEDELEVMSKAIGKTTDVAVTALNRADTAIDKIGAIDKAKFWLLASVGSIIVAALMSLIIPS